MSDSPGTAATIIRIVDGTPRIVDDDWRVLDSAEEWDCAWDHAPDDGSAGILLPLEIALAQPERVRAGARSHGRMGIWLAPAEEPARAAALFDAIALVGVQFPRFTDGRGYSTAVLLRTRLGWHGELRALGEVLQDQLFALRRVGFDSFALCAGRDPAAALGAFAPFSDVYQGSVDQPLPRFRRTPPAP